MPCPIVLWSIGGRGDNSWRDIQPSCRGLCHPEERRTLKCVAIVRAEYGTDAWSVPPSSGILAGER
jgi:hypothetical protein